MTRTSRMRYTAAGSQHIWLSRECELREAVLLRRRIAIWVLSARIRGRVTCSRFEYPEPSTTC